MRVSSPFVIVLSDPQRRELSRRARSVRASHRDRVRARIVLAAGEGRANAAIARESGLSQDTVRKWRKRFVTGRLAGLRDTPRPGRPRRLPDAVRTQETAYHRRDALAYLAAGVVQRKVVTPNNFTDLDEIRTRLAEFEIRYNAVAGPYNRRFTRIDLNALLDRLAVHEQARHDLAAWPPTN